MQITKTKKQSKKQNQNQETRPKIHENKAEQKMNIILHRVFEDL